MHILPLIFDVSSVALLLAHGYALHRSPIVSLLWNRSMSFRWVAFWGATLQSPSRTISSSAVTSRLM